jgi:hypothetical protein
MDDLQPALWAFPAAFGAHVIEEAAGSFAEWAQRRASPRYTQRDFVRNNALGFVMTLGSTALVTRPGRRGFRLHYALVLTQQGNAVFHAATGAPGRLTALGVVLPLRVRITHLARRERLLSRRDVAAALALGGALHGLAVPAGVLPGPRRDESAATATRTGSTLPLPVGSV